MKRVKVVVLLSLIVTLFVSTKAFAVVDDYTFEDVDEDTAYAEQIEILAKDGIIKGYEDGTFRPDNFISVAEAITLAERRLGDVTRLPANWSDWNTDRWDNHLSLYGQSFDDDYYRVTNYEVASEILLKMIDIKPIDTSLWFGTYSYPKCSVYTENFQMRGYVRPGFESLVPHKGVTRGEFCAMLIAAEDMTVDYLIPVNFEPIVQTEVLISRDYTTWEFQNITAKSGKVLIQIPETIRQRFTDDGGLVWVLDDVVWDEAVASDGKNGRDYSGAYTPLTKEVWINEGHYIDIPHEIGHYVSDILKTKGVWRPCIRDEYLVDDYIPNSDYFRKDADELFAEAFRNYCTKNDTMKIYCPELYDYVEDAVNLFLTLE